MNYLESTIRDIFSNQIKERITLGLIPYERQLQAELHYELRLILPDNYKIWIEPIIYLKEYGLDKIRPDLIITENYIIKSIIELKHVINGEPKFKSDIEKLLKFELAIEKDDVELSLSSAILNSEEPDVISFVRHRLDKELLSVFVAFGSENCKAFTEKFEMPKNFLFVIGYFKKNNELKIEFRN
jgi:hypothetical protein